MVQDHQYFYLSFLRRSLFLLLLAASQSVVAQTLVNGQIFTNGLTIVDAPAMNSQLHAGSDLNLAIDVSGNGKLPEEARVPGSDKSTRFDDLQIYLTSSQSRQNFTVSGDSTLLSQEPGSTVKHLNWPIPRCLTAGSFNLTLYESSHVDNNAYYSITSLPLSIDNASPEQDCPSDVASNSFAEGDSQVSSPPSHSPFLSPDSVSGSSGTGPQVITITLSASGGLPFPFPPTVTVTPSQVSTVTVVVERPTTVTTQISETMMSTFTTTFISTMTALQPAGATDISGFLPISAGHIILPSALSWILISLISALWVLM